MKSLFLILLGLILTPALAKDLTINLQGSVRNNIDLIKEIRRAHPHINTTRYRLSAVTFDAVADSEYATARLYLGMNHSSSINIAGSPQDFTNNNYVNYHINAPWSGGYASINLRGGKIKVSTMVLHLERIGNWQPELGPLEQVGYFEPARSSVNSFYANVSPNRPIAQIIFQADNDPDIYVRRIFILNSFNNQIQLFNGKREIDDDDPAWILNYPYHQNMQINRIRVDADTASRWSPSRGKLKVLVRYWND